MRLALPLMLAAWTAGAAFAQPTADDAQLEMTEEVKQSRAAVQQFSGALKEALQQAINDGGPVNGITVCHEKASQIAERLSQELEMLVGRTSLKVRNPNNTPDAWESAVLMQFEARKAQGEAVDTLEFFAVIDDDQGKSTFRYMKAIPAASLCLTCHGDKIDPEVDVALKKLYPYDKARGFREGELRGAFTIAKPLP